MPGTYKFFPHPQVWRFLSLLEFPFTEQYQISQGTFLHFQAFPTFIKFIVNRTIANNWHVYRYWERCDLCHWNYDIIGKMETFTSDADYVMSKIGMKENNLLYRANKSAGNSTADLALELFAKLPQDLKKQLYELYKIDFEMFEYDAKPFL